MPSLAAFTHRPHPHTLERIEHRDAPVLTGIKAPTGGPLSRWNTWLAIKVTSGVGTMWCAYAFTGIALLGLPQTIHDTTTAGFHPLPLVQFVAQTFLQLVLLSVIIVGQNIQAAAADARAEATYEDADAVLHEAIQIQAHLADQDAVLVELITRLERMEGGTPAGGGRPATR